MFDAFHNCDLKADIDIKCKNNRVVDHIGTSSLAFPPESKVRTALPVLESFPKIEEIRHRYDHGPVSDTSPWRNRPGI